MLEFFAARDIRRGEILTVDFLGESVVGAAVRYHSLLRYHSLVRYDSLACRLSQPKTPVRPRMALILRWCAASTSVGAGAEAPLVHMRSVHWS